MEYEGSSVEKNEKKIIADFHVLGLFKAFKLFKKIWFERIKNSICHAPLPLLPQLPPLWKNLCHTHNPPLKS
jgi:hypothetical protein